MTPDDVLGLFKQHEALLEGHFRLSSGLHSTGYLQCARVLQHPPAAATLGTALAALLRGEHPDAVIAPALGGIVIGHEVARALGVRGLFAEREQGVLTLRRGFSLSAGERVVVIEDVVTTGGSTRETIEVVRAAGAMVVGTGAVIDRLGAGLKIGVPFHALARLELPTYDAAACPACEAGVALVKPGSRPDRRKV